MRYLSILISFLLLSCTQLTVKDEVGKPYALAPDEVAFSVMSYNTNRLLNSSPEAKFEHLARAIRSGGQEHRGPDLLILQEVQSEEALSKLRDDYLSDLGYRDLIFIAEKAQNGLNVAVLSRFDVVGMPQLHPTPVPGSPGILEAVFRLPDNRLLTTYAVHFPAPSEPTSARIQVFNKLNQLVSRLPKDRLFIAGGAFNFTTDEDQTLDRLAKDNWLLAHEINREGRWPLPDMILFSRRFQVSAWDFREIRIIKNDSDRWPVQVIFSQKVSVI